MIEFTSKHAFHSNVLMGPPGGNEWEPTAWKLCEIWQAGIIKCDASKLHTACSCLLSRPLCEHFTQKGLREGKYWTSMTPTLECLLAVGLRNFMVLYYFLVIAAIQSHNFMWGRRVHMQHCRFEMMGLLRDTGLQRKSAFKTFILFHASYSVFCVRCACCKLSYALQVWPKGLINQTN